MNPSGWRRRRPASTAARAGIWPIGLVWLLLVLLVCKGVPGLGLKAAHADGSGGAQLSPKVATLDAKDGLWTATFLDQTDDAALAAAIPALISRGVEAIDLRGAPVHDTRSIAQISGLKRLDLSGTQVRDLSPLAALKDLRALDLQFLRVSDLGPISGLRELRSLNIGGTIVADLTPLSDLTNLRDLVAALSRVKDLMPLARLHGLLSLDFGSTWVSDLSPLAGMSNLTFLNLNGTPVKDITALGRMTNLRTLDLGGTQISDLRPLVNARALRSLNIEGTQVADVTPLANLPALRTVALGGSLVRNRTPLAHLATATQSHPETEPLDAVLFWNDQTNRMIQATGTNAFAASRLLALESIAVMDTVKSIDDTPAFMVRFVAPRDIPVGAAIAAAAHATLVHAFPAQKASLDAALAYSLAAEPAGPARTKAVGFGEAVAAALDMMRDGDGSMDAGVSRAGALAGQWRPTPPDYLPPMAQQWATMVPFAMTRPSQFRPPGPPDPQSDAFRQAKAEVMTLGAADSTVRTADQTQIAHYWSDAIGTYAPAGHWNAIAANTVRPLRLGLSVEAELFAELNVAMGDAGIAQADAKYTYWSRRPITAIRTGDSTDPGVESWTPLLETPNHPSYISGHSTFSGAAATVMKAWFGTRGFTFSSPSLPAVTRSFTSFDQAAEEAAASRVYGGIHFPFDNADGLTTGKAIGAWTMSVFQRLGTDRGPLLMVMDGSMKPGGDAPRAIQGCALDNLHPLAAITVSLDGGAPFSVAVDENGLFTLPAGRVGLSGRHDVVLAATSSSGRTSTLRATVE